MLNSYKKGLLTPCSWIAFKRSLTKYPLIFLLVNFFHDEVTWTLADLKVWRLVEIVECCGQPQGPQHQQQEQQRALPNSSRRRGIILLAANLISSEIPTPHRPVSVYVPPPPPGCGGRTNSLGGERVGGQYCSSEDARQCSVLYICKYLVVRVHYTGRFYTQLTQTANLFWFFICTTPVWYKKSLGPFFRDYSSVINLKFSHTELFLVDVV